MIRSKITVLIPVKDDPKTIKCVASIDAEAHIVIVFNGAKQDFVHSIKDSLKSRDIDYHELPHPNLSWALEYGIRHAPSNLVLMMDSDCEFVPGAIESFYDIAEKYDTKSNVFKGDVIFQKGNSYMSKVIAKSRFHHTAEVLTAYKPPLLVDKRIRSMIGGYFFDDRLVWREDSDFDNRIRQAGIGIIPVEAGKIKHGSLSMQTDFRSTFRYGIGLAIADVLHIKLTEVPRSVISTLMSQGIAPALYMIFRNRIYDLGYWITRYQVFTKKRTLNESPNIDYPYTSQSHVT